MGMDKLCANVGMEHLLVCPNLPQPCCRACTNEDLEVFNPRARSCGVVIVIPEKGLRMEDYRNGSAPFERVGVG